MWCVIIMERIMRLSVENNRHGGPYVFCGKIVVFFGYVGTIRSTLYLYNSKSELQKYIEA